MFLELTNWFALNGLKLKKTTRFSKKSFKNIIVINIDNCHAVENAVLLGPTTECKLN